MSKTVMQRIKGKKLSDYIRFGFEYIKNQIDTLKLSETMLRECGVTEVKRDTPIIVSLTSFPSRIEAVSECVKTLLNQTMKPDRVILWLAEEQFPNKRDDLPQRLVDLEQYGLEIMWCNDIRSYKKLIPTLKLFPDAVIVTSDDDQYYDRDWLALLYKGYQDNPRCIQCHRITKLIKNQNGEWAFIVGGRDIYDFPSTLNKLVGCGGVLYPPNSLYRDCTRDDLFMKLAPTNDDVWFWFMAILNGYRIRVVNNRIMWNKTVRGTGNSALSNVNNDNVVLEQMRNILKYYPEIERLMSEEYESVKQ